MRCKAYEKEQEEVVSVHASQGSDREGQEGEEIRPLGYEI